MVCLINKFVYRDKRDTFYKHKGNFHFYFTLMLKIRVNFFISINIDSPKKCRKFRPKAAVSQCMWR